MESIIDWLIEDQINDMNGATLIFLGLTVALIVACIVSKKVRNYFFPN